MANTIYEVKLSTDGAHSVSVSSDDQAAVKEALTWVRGVYMTLEGRARKEREEAKSEANNLADEEPPICEVHGIPMARVQGRKGEFFSCHEKMPDGSWCSYKPAKD